MPRSKKWENSKEMGLIRTDEGSRCERMLAALVGKGWKDRDQDKGDLLVPMKGKLRLPER